MKNLLRKGFIKEMIIFEMGIVCKTIEKYVTGNKSNKDYESLNHENKHITVNIKK